MAFDTATIAAIVRQRLGDIDASRRSRVIWAIPQAIEKLARKIAANPRKRSILMTVKEGTSSTITDGVLNLIPHPEILVEYIRYGTIWITPTAGSEYAHPLQWIEPYQAGAPQTLADDYYYGYVESPEQIRIKNLGGDDSGRLNGSAKLACPRRPTLAEFEVLLVELQDELIDKVIEICSGPESDAAEDDQH
jgi:hypothetical protein